MRNAFALVRTNRRAIAINNVHPSVNLSVCPSAGTSVHCDQTVYVSAHLSLRLHSPMFGTLTPKRVHLLPSVFFQFHLERRLGMNDWLYKPSPIMPLHRVCKTIHLLSTLYCTFYTIPILHIFNWRIFIYCIYYIYCMYIRFVLSVLSWCLVFTRTWLRYVRVFAVAIPSVVCNVGAPYSWGLKLSAIFLHRCVRRPPLTSVHNFTEIFIGEPGGTPSSEALNTGGVARRLYLKNSLAFWNSLKFVNYRNF